MIPSFAAFFRDLKMLAKSFYRGASGFCWCFSFCWHKRIIICLRLCALTLIATMTLSVAGSLTDWLLGAVAMGTAMVTITYWIDQ